MYFYFSKSLQAAAYVWKPLNEDSYFTNTKYNHNDQKPESMSLFKEAEFMTIALLRFWQM